MADPDLSPYTREELERWLSAKEGAPASATANTEPGQTPGLYASGMGGLERGLLGVATLPAAAGEAALGGIGYGAEKLLPESIGGPVSSGMQTAASYIHPYTYGERLKEREQKYGPIPEGQTGAEKAAQTLGEFAPGIALSTLTAGGAAPAQLPLFARAGVNALPKLAEFGKGLTAAGASEVGGRLTEGTPAENITRMISALIGHQAPGVLKRGLSSESLGSGLGYLASALASGAHELPLAGLWLGGQVGKAVKDIVSGLSPAEAARGLSSQAKLLAGSPLPERLQITMPMPYGQRPPEEQTNQP